MVKLTGVFSQISPRRIMVIGDLMLDTYTIGKAKRISPEAPVAVVQVQKEEHRPGGAGNVMLNLISLGAKVIAVGRVGSDSAGDLLCKTLLAEGIEIQGIFRQPAYQTPVKNRILADNQQIVRVDYENHNPLPEFLEQQVIEALPRLIAHVDVIAISDYAKGFLSKILLRAIIDHAKEKGISVIADPKGIDFDKYSGASVIKPNLGEAYAAANLGSGAPLEQVASRILQLTGAQTIMITRSEAGISLFNHDGSRQDFPVKVREVKDVTGAGDTVLAMVACAIANELPMSAAAQLSNVAAGLAIERFGCARISLGELARRLFEEDVSNKIFDDEHLFGLQKILSEHPYKLLSIDSRDGFTQTLFETIRQLKKENKDLLVYFRDQNPHVQVVHVLTSLHEVNFIILKGDSLRSLALTSQPEASFSIENGKCIKTEMLELMKIQE